MTLSVLLAATLVSHLEGYTMHQSKDTDSRAL